MSISKNFLKKILLGISSLITIGTILIVSFDKNNDEIKMTNDENLIISNPSNRAVFNGIVLTREAVIQMGWDQKEYISILDWQFDAPNVTQIGGIEQHEGYISPFNENSLLKKITIPNRIKKIGTLAFSKTTSLQELIFESNSTLELIGLSAFSDSNLSSITIPESVTLIRGSAFKGSKLTSVYVPDKVSEIENFVFSNTALLRNISMPIHLDQGFETNQYKYGFTFEQAQLIQWRPVLLVTVLLKIDYQKLGWHLKKDITLADWANFPNVTQIGDGTLENAPFANNTFHQSIAIPARVTTISSRAFSQTNSLRTITIEGNSELTTIGDHSFSQSYALENINLNAAAKLITIGTEAFSLTKIKNIYLHNSVGSIGSNAFYNTGTKLSISILSPLRQNSANPLYGFSQADWNIIDWRPVPFLGTSLSKNDVINNGFDRKNSITYNDWQTWAPNVVEIGQDAFANLSTLELINIPRTITSIGSSAFLNTTNFASIVFPSNSQLTTIGANAFRNSGLRALTLPNSLESIGTDAFRDTNQLLGNQISIPRIFKQNSQNPLYGFTSNQWDAINWLIFVFEGTILTKREVQNLGWDDKATITLDDWANWAPNVTHLGDPNVDSGEGNEAPFSLNSVLESIVLPAKITNIGFASFFSTPSLVNVTFENNSKLQTIGHVAFKQSAITSINIPNSVTSIGNLVFLETNSLLGNQVSMLSTLRQNSSSARYGFSQAQWDIIDWRPVQFLGTILTKNDVINIGWNKNTTITLVDWTNWAPNVISIGDSALNDGTNNDLSQSPFANNSILTSIQIPSTIQNINYGSFAYATSLISVEFSGTSQLQSIRRSAFEGSGITSINIPNSVTIIDGFAFNKTNSLPGDKVSMLSSLRKNSSNPLYGFTQTQWNAITWRPIQFSGTILTKNDVINIGWNKKTTITLLDWTNWAPNVTQMGEPSVVSGSGSNAPFEANQILSSIQIPSRITKINFATFSRTSALNSVTFEANSRLEFVGNESFKLTSLTTIQIPRLVQIIGQFAFSESQLQTITFEENSQLTNIQDSAFNSTFIASITLPNLVTTIGSNVFLNTNSLLGNQVSMPSMLRQNSDIPLYGFTQEQWDAISWRPIQFTGAILTKNDVINMGWNKKTTITLDDWANWAPNVTHLGDPNVDSGEGNEAPFSLNSILESIVIPARIINIGFASFFSTPSLVSITFENNSTLESIGHVAFKQSAITAINIPNSVTSIGNLVFLETSALHGNQVSAMVALRQDSSSPLYGFTQAQWDEIDWIPILEITGNILTKNDVIKLGWNKKRTIGLQDWESSAPNVTQIGIDNSSDLSQSAFASNSVLQSIEIPSRITKINFGSFNLASSLRIITFEQNSQLLEIGNRAFEGVAITRIAIPHLVTTIGVDAFKNITTLVGNSITMLSTLRNNSFSPLYGFTQTQWDNINWIPIVFDGTILTKNDVINIGWAKKQTITLSDWINWAPNVVQIGATNSSDLIQSPFSSNTILQSIEIPAKVTSINFGSFHSATLTAITFATGSQLLSIGDRTFEDSGITSINIPNSVTTIGTDAFKNTSALPGNRVSVMVALRQDSSNSLYGFTQVQWDEIDWIPILEITGNILTKNDVIKLGWNKKRTIGLEDWESSAPNVTQIGIDNSSDLSQSAFASNSVLQSIQIPSRITKINFGSFHLASSLKIITFEQNSRLLEIGNRAFEGVAITRITIPHLVTTIGTDAFKNTSVLAGNQISMLSTLRQNSSSSLYGFTQVQWDNINWSPIVFGGTILTKDDVINIGWAKKQTITLSDWINWAPNVLQIGATNSSDLIESPFSSNTILQSIEIPAKVTSINFGSFHSATLTAITFATGSQLSNIGDRTFEGSGITSINIPNSVATIGTDAFKNTSALPGNQVSAMVTLRQDSSSPLYGFTQEQWNIIEWRAISEVLGTILTKNDVIKLGWDRKSSITLDDWESSAPNVTQIGIDNSSDLTQSAFASNTILQSIQIPSRITKINFGSFNLTTSLRTVNFEQGSQLLEIGDQVFEGSGITRIVIPNSVTNIGINAFNNITNLVGNQISMLSTLRKNSLSPLYGFTQTQWDNIDWIPIIFNGTILTKNDVINIGWAKKQTITLSDWINWAPNVVQIGATNSNDLSQSAFASNTILQSIQIPAKVISINFGSFHSATLTAITFATSSQLSNIGDRTFEGSGITSINIPNSVATIGTDAFKNTSALPGNRVSAMVTLRQDSSDSLYGFTQAQWNVIEWRAISEVNGTILTKNDVIKLGWDRKRTISLEDWESSAPNVTQIGIDNSSDLTQSAFASNTILQSIQIPSRIIKINFGTFNLTISLRTVNFEQGSQLLEIGDRAFEGSGITSISLPNLVTKIATNVFKNTGSLDGNQISMLSTLRQNSLVPLYGFTQVQWDNINWIPVKFNGEILTKDEIINLGWSKKITITLADWILWAPNVTKIGIENSSDISQAPFANNTFIQSIEIPAKVLSINFSAFKSSNLRTITFASNSQLLKIGQNAFQGTNLTSINVPDSVTTIDANAFSNINSLNQISMVSTLRQNSLVPLYGFTQAQWDNIEWRSVKFNGEILTKDEIINLGWDKKTKITLTDWLLFAPNVTKIGNENSSDLNQSPFAHHTFIQSIEIPAKVLSINFGAFKSSTLKSISFESDSQLIKIGKDAFSATTITSINVPNLVTEIGENAFENTNSLNQISMVSTLRQNSSNPLYGFTQDQWDSINWTLNLFSGEILTKNDVINLGWDKKTTITLADWILSAPNVLQIGFDAVGGEFDNSPFASNTTLQSIEIPAKITAINYGAFYSTSSLRTISFEENSKLFAIGKSSFEGAGITELILPGSVKIVGDLAFKNTNRLAGDKISMPITLSKNLETPFYGFTQAQWDLINWFSLTKNLTKFYIVTGSLSGVLILLLAMNALIIFKLRKINNDENNYYKSNDEEDNTEIWEDKYY